MRRIIAVALLGIGGAWGQGIAVPPAFETVRKSDSYRQAVVSVYEKYEGSLTTQCKKVDADMNASKVRVLGHFQTDAKGNILEGTWKETTEGTACGEKRLYNAAILVRGGKPQVYWLFPGHSYAGPVLQHDAVHYAALAAQPAQGCAIDILDTALPLGEPSASGIPWVEKWTVQACGKRSLVTIHFVPDATGTTMQVSLKETAKLP